MAGLKRVMVMGLGKKRKEALRVRMPPGSDSIRTQELQAFYHSLF